MSSCAAEMNRGGKFQAILPGTTTKTAYTGTAAASAAVGAGVSIVRVVCTTNACIAFGTAPTATTSDIYMAAGVPEYFAIPEGSSYKVSAVRIADSGDMYVTAGSAP
jgi:hypothetical protein